MKLWLLLFTLALVSAEYGSDRNDTLLNVTTPVNGAGNNTNLQNNTTLLNNTSPLNNITGPGNLTNTTELPRHKGWQYCLNFTLKPDYKPPPCYEPTPSYPNPPIFIIVEVLILNPIVVNPVISKPTLIMDLLMYQVELIQAAEAIRAILDQDQTIMF